jgi:Zn-dependent peptidase ImmA (M78 family)
MGLWINEYVDGLIECFGTSDIYELYDYLDIKILKIDSENIMLQGNDAVYYRDFEDHEMVFIRNDVDRHCERLILAHELGHAIMHTDIYVAAYNNPLFNLGKMERQADYFANILLEKFEQGVANE